MEKFKLFLIYLISFLLQCTVINCVAVAGVTPNILLVLTIVYSFFFRDADGIVFSVIFGLFQDMFFGQVIGISALTYFMTGMILRMARGGVYRDNKLLLAILTAAFTLFHTVSVWFLSRMMLQTDLSLLFWLKQVPVSILLNYIVLLIILPAARKRRGFTT